MTPRRAHFYAVSEDPNTIEEARHAVDACHKDLVFKALGSIAELPDNLDLRDWVLLDLDESSCDDTQNRHTLGQLCGRSQTVVTQSVTRSVFSSPVPEGPVRSITKPHLKRQLARLLADTASDMLSWMDVDETEQLDLHLQSDELEAPEIALATRVANFAARIAKLDRDQVVRACVSKLPDLFRARSISVYKLDERSRHLLLLGTNCEHDIQPLTALNDAAPEPSFQIGPARRNEFAETWDRIQAVFGVPNAHLESGVYRTASTILAPITAGNRLIGAIHLAESLKRDGFDRTDIALTGPICRLIGAALNNVRVFEGLREQARTDGLTSLPNRRTFTAQLNREMMRARRYRSPLTLAMIDLDGLKDINDTHGHQAGDAVLQEAAERLRAVIREIDLPARYGGDEFAVILPNTTLDQAQNVADRIASEMAERPCQWLESGIRATLSIGLCEYRNHASAAEFIQAADDALYQAKAEGKNRVTIANG